MKLKTITSLSLLALATLAIPPTTANGQEHGWIFDRDHVSGRTVSDAHGDLSGSISGEILLEDQPAALVLNGETTHVSVEEADESMLPERNITVEAWVLLNRGTRWGGIMGYLQDNGDFERGWVLGYDNDDFVFGLSTDDDLTYMDSPEDFTPGAWHHVVGTYDGDTMRLYVDGELVETSGARSGDIDYSDASFTLGAYVDDNEFWGMDGKIHEANLYASTLSDEEIRERYLAKRNLFLGDEANPGGPGKPGEPCEGIQEIVEGTYTGDTTQAATNGSASCGNSSDSPARIYLYRPGSDGRLTVSTCESGYDTVLSIHSACPPDEANQLGCNDDTCELQSSVSADVTSGTAYYIRVSGYNGNAGDYTLAVETDDGSGGALADAVVSDVTGMEQRGRLGDEASFAMRTVICNLGDAPMDWHRNPDPRHPFLVFNMYKLTETRVEQIGQSWVKHGYSASQGGGCGEACIRFGSTQYLGVGCSDVYGVGTNARQSTFGPRNEINPWTGGYTFEGSHLDLDSDGPFNPVENILRAHDDDLDPATDPSARYFVELLVITHDDSDHTNSVGYKEFSIAGQPGGVWDTDFHEGAASPGNILWEWFGGDFTIFPEDAPEEDGRSYLKTKVTDNGDGTWHYEYAIYNLDMRRALGSFSLPVPQGVTLSNINFHAPLSHGEGYSNEPWQVRREGSTLTWSTDDLAENPEANPLRWGTLYNFSFDADAEPEDATVELTPWLPGGIQAYQGTAKAPSGGGDGNPLHFKRSDADLSGEFSLSDAVLIANYLFLGAREPACHDAADSDDSGTIDLTDVILPLNWYFSGGSEPAPPGPNSCGADPTPLDDLPECNYDPAGC